MKLSPLFILLLLCFQSQAQPYFGNYYKNTTASYVAIPCIDRCYDGSIIGTSTIDGGSNSFKLFKLSESGTMLWQRKIELSVPIYIPFQVCALRDSTIAILISPQSTGDFIILRCDINGQLLSIWNYENTFTDALFIRPFGNDGVLAAGGFGMVMIDASGNIVHNYRFPGISFNSVEEKSPGIFTCIGQRGCPHCNLLLFDVNATGNISNAFTYPLSADSIYMYSSYPSKLIARSPGGRIYCARSLGDSPLQKFLVSYFDSNNQPVWSRKIEYPDLKVTQILADKNNGCIVTSDVGSYMPAIFKFDSTGTLEWTKLLGDSSSINMKYFSVFDMIPDAGSGWYVRLQKHNNYIFHSDSVFSTFCSSETFQPVISNTTPGHVTDSLSSVTVTTATRTALTATSLTQNIFQYDACTDMQVSVEAPEKYSLDLFPNPASEKITITNVSNEIKSISIFNLLGEELISKNVTGLHRKSISIDVSALPPGIYMVHSIASEKVWIGKFVKE